MRAWRTAAARVAATRCRHATTFLLGPLGGGWTPLLTHADAVSVFVEVAKNARAASAIAATVVACFRVVEPPLGDRSGLPREWNGPEGRGAGGAHGAVVLRRCL
jgi:hypothetical protein